MSCPFENMKTILDTGIKTVTSDQLFTTPPHVAERMASCLNLDDESLVLEPSAGTGVLIDAIINTGCEINACEINADLCAGLYNECNNVYNMDFMDMSASPIYDAVIMNPPFSNMRDIKHIKHALGFLKEGGRLVAICANGARQERELQPLCTSWEVLPQGTFKQSGTMVNTVLLVIDK